MTARDPGLDFDFAGMVDLNDSVPNYDFGLDLRHADLALLRINPRDSVSVLRAQVKAKAAGRSLDDLNGRIRITDAAYRYNDSSVAAREIVVRGENSAHSKFLSLQSDFADVTFRSKTSYREVFRYLRMSAWKYLPMLGTRERAPQHEAAPSAADDYSLLSVEIKRINPLVDAVARGLQVADGSHLRLLFNPATGCRSRPRRTTWSAAGCLPPASASTPRTAATRWLSMPLRRTSTPACSTCATSR